MNECREEVTKRKKKKEEKQTGTYHLGNRTTTTTKTKNTINRSQKRKTKASQQQQRGDFHRKLNHTESFSFFPFSSEEKMMDSASAAVAAAAGGDDSSSSSRPPKVYWNEPRHLTCGTPKPVFPLPSWKLSSVVCAFHPSFFFRSFSCERNDEPLNTSLTKIFTCWGAAAGRGTAEGGKWVAAAVSEHRGDTAGHEQAQKLCDTGGVD